MDYPVPVRLRPACIAVAFVVALLCLLAPSGRPAHAATFVYQKGWNLVAGPPDTVFAGAADPLYSLNAAGDGYASVSADQPAAAGAAYFAYFPVLTLVRAAADDHTPVTIQAPAGAWTMIGNPSAFSAATVSGADAVYVYDQQGGFLVQSSVPPGAGALVYSAEGGSVTITPNTAGLEAHLSTQEDKLIDLGVSAADLPSGFDQTRADANGAQNANVPVTYIEEFRPRTAPKATDPEQTTFVQVNIQQAKDIDYAALLLNGTTDAQLKQNFGANVRSVTDLPSPTVGDAARLFKLALVNGNTQTGAYYLAFRTLQVFVAIYTLAPLNRENSFLPTAIAQRLDPRIRAAFAVPPAAPSGLHATAVDATHIRVDWTRNSDNESGFEVYDVGNARSAGTVPDNAVTYTVGGLQSGTRYCFAVFAYNQFGESSFSNQDCAATPGQ